MKRYLIILIMLIIPSVSNASGNIFLLRNEFLLTNKKVLPISSYKYRSTSHTDKGYKYELYGLYSIVGIVGLYNGYKLVTYAALNRKSSYSDAKGIHDNLPYEFNSPINIGGGIGTLGVLSWMLLKKHIIP